jgi:hypothetical protein
MQRGGNDEVPYETNVAGLNENLLWGIYEVGIQKIETLIWELWGYMV